MGVGAWPVALVILLAALPFLRSKWSLIAAPVALSAFLLLVLRCRWFIVPVVGWLSLYAASWVCRWVEEIRLPAVRHERRGDRYREDGKHERAIEEYTKALEAGPEHPAVVHLSRGIAFAGTQAYDEAIADIDQALALEPKMIAAYLHRGRAYHGKGAHDRALADLNRAIELSTEYGEAHLQRGLVHEAQGEYPEALADVEKALSCPDRPVLAHYHKARLHERLGEPEQARAAYKKFLRIGKWLDTIPWDAPKIKDAGARLRQLRGKQPTRT